MRSRLPALALASALALLTAAPSGDGPERPEPAIDDLAVTVDGTRALVTFRLESAVDEALFARAESGLPTGFAFQLELLKDRKRWYDRPLEETTYQVTALYDGGSRAFLVNVKLGGELVESRMVSTREELATALTEVAELPAFALDSFPRAWRLLVRVRADLGESTWLGFWPTRATTPWRESNKFRSPNELPP